jgi:G3E family GTPase
MYESFKIAKERIPVTIITGFLGSGKTTLLKNIIRKNPNTRFAIIENEFGEMGVDGELVSAENSMVYELTNGCICCSLSRDFYNSLQIIVEKHFDIDHLLIETTGIADPMSVIDLFISNNTLEKHFQLNSVICLTDASNLENTLNSEIDARKQIALSDLVIVNKADKASISQLDSLKARIADINPMAEIVETSYAQTNGTPILHTHAYSSSHVEKTTKSYRNINVSLHDLARSSNIALEDRKNHRHDIHAEGFIFDECFDQELFNIWMSSYLYFNQGTLYRVKGILNFREKDKRSIFQAVKGSYLFEDGTEWKDDEKRYSKIVFIGKSIDRVELGKSLKKLFRDFDTKSKRISA